MNCAGAVAASAQGIREIVPVGDFAEADEFLAELSVFVDEHAARGRDGRSVAGLGGRRFDTVFASEFVFAHGSEVGTRPVVLETRRARVFFREIARKSRWFLSSCIVREQEKPFVQGQAKEHHEFKREVAKND